MRLLFAPLAWTLGLALTTVSLTAQEGKPPQTQEKPAPTMTGTWLIEAQHSAGVSTPTATITQTGGTLTGTYTGSYGQFELAGSIKGADFTFSVEIGSEQTVTVVYTGTLNGDYDQGLAHDGRDGAGHVHGQEKVNAEGRML